MRGMTQCSCTRRPRGTSRLSAARCCWLRQRARRAWPRLRVLGSPALRASTRCPGPRKPTPRPPTHASRQGTPGRSKACTGRSARGLDEEAGDLVVRARRPHERSGDAAALGAGKLEEADRAKQRGVGRAGRHGDGHLVELAAETFRGERGDAAVDQVVQAAELHTGRAALWRRDGRALARTTVAAAVLRGLRRTTWTSSTRERGTHRWRRCSGRRRPPTPQAGALTQAEQRDTRQEPGGLTHLGAPGPVLVRGRDDGVRHDLDQAPRRRQRRRWRRVCAAMLGRGAAATLARVVERDGYDADGRHALPELREVWAHGEPDACGSEACEHGLCGCPMFRSLSRRGGR